VTNPARSTRTTGPDGRRARGRPKFTPEQRAAADADQKARGTWRRDRSPEASPLAPVVIIPPRAYVDLATAYADDVVSGRIVACQWVRLAAHRYRRDRQRAADDPSCSFVFVDDEAIRACHFIEQLPHVEGVWATRTITLAPWQVFVVVNLFGFRDRVDPTRRRFTNLYLEVARKAAKSTLMAAIALYHVVEEHEPGAQVVCGATTGSQARIVFAIAQRMVMHSPYLRSRGLLVYANAIVTDDATIKPINSHASTQDGLNPSCIVLDESHAQTFKLHDVLKSAQGARRNPLLVCPTTAGYDLLSVGYALRTTSTRVLEGVVVADHLFAVIYTIDEGDDWRDERVWIKANPMIGITPRLDYMRRYALDAQSTPGLEAEFRVKACSEWLNAASAWLSITAWDACAEPGVSLDHFAGRPCWIGGDLAQLDDLAAVALVFKRGDDLVAFVRCYCPEQVVDDRARAVPYYREWSRPGGPLILTPGNMIDYGRIESDVRADCRRFDVRAVAFDQFGSMQLIGNLANDGINAYVDPKNAARVTPAARELETRVRHGRLKHDGNPCVRWQAGNAVVSRRVDDSILPKKESPESPNKIDAIDALVSAIGAWLRDDASAKKQFQILVFGGGS
jgi:phage terminase large subunit-like protein